MNISNILTIILWIVLFSIACHLLNQPSDWAAACGILIIISLIYKLIKTIQRL
jgi:hypothetical protein